MSGPDDQPIETKATVNQRLLWLMNHYQGNNGALNLPVALRLRGQLDGAALQHAVDDLTARHPSLRTTVTRSGRRLTQVVHPARPVPISTADLTRSSQPETAAMAALTRELRTDIDPEVWPTRAALFRMGREDHLFALSAHHIVTDAWSMTIVGRDLGMLYDQARGGDTPLPPLGASYTDFVDYQSSRLTPERIRKHQDAWRQVLAGARFPKVVEDSSVSGQRADVVTRTLRKDVTAKLHQLAQTERTTFFVVMFTVFVRMLSRLTGQSDISVPTLFANRARREFANTVGFFANMEILRLRVPTGAPAHALVPDARASVLHALAHQEMPLQMLARDSLPAGPGRAEDLVFQMFAPPPYPIRFGGLIVEQLRALPGLAGRWKLEFILIPADQEVELVMVYDTESFSHDIVNYMADNFIAECQQGTLIGNRL